VFQQRCEASVSAALQLNFAFRRAPALTTCFNHFFKLPAFYTLMIILLNAARCC